jgi:signal transduction histidine kinase
VRPRLVLISVVGFLMGVVDVWLAADSRYSDGTTVGQAFAPVVVWSWVGIGVYATSRRPQNRFGTTMVAVGFVYFLTTLTSSSHELIFSLAFLTSGVFIASIVHMLLAYPTGRLESRRAAGFVIASYLLLLSANLSLALLGGPCHCGPDHPPLVLTIVHAPELADTLFSIALISALVLAVGLIVLLWRRLRLATTAERRSLAPVLTTGMMFVDALAISALLDLIGMPSWLVQLPDVVGVLALCALPYTFLISLARSRWFRAGAVAELVERLNGQRRRSLRDALADALGDDDLRLLTWIPRDQRFLDEQGRPFTAQDIAGRALTEVERDGRRVGAIVHDPALLEDTDLVAASVNAVAMALENERLEAELRARVAELEVSRERVIEVGLAERRRLERDLHDGAQQRLVALGLQVAMARAKLDADPEAAGRLLDQARDELRQAQAELRELARGIHPAILTDRGLGAAVTSLAERSTIPAYVTEVPEQRLPAAVEAIAYFVVAESLTNVAKHARARQAEVTVRRENGHAVVLVSDDGVGGAGNGNGRNGGDGLGSGLRGLSDRLAAVDGRLTVHSPPGAGTVIRAEIPCASS